MTKRFIPVEGHDGYVRDLSSGAIISINSDELEKRKALRAIKRQEKNRIEKIENEMSEIKALLTQLIEKS
jgi:phosphopantetheine adenylyltransferase